MTLYKANTQSTALQAGMLVLVLYTSLTAGENAHGDALSPPISMKIVKVEDFDNTSDAESLMEKSDPSFSKIGVGVGSVQKQNGKQLLILKGHKIFEGYTLSSATSSTDGTIAVSSYSGSRNQIDGDGSDAVIDKNTGKLIQAISSVWIIQPSGLKRKITWDTMHATHPVISRDGKWLAFSGQALDQNGIAAVQQVYVVRLQNGLASSPVALNLPSRGSIFPVIFDKTDQLIVVTTQDESPAAWELTWLKIDTSQ